MATTIHIKTVYSSDGKRKIVFQAREDGFFEFVDEQLITDEYVGKIWTPIYFSGIFGALESAELEARRRLDPHVPS